VLEQASHVGGRVATREIGGARFDQGAQFFTARCRDFKLDVASWEMRRVVRRWFDGYPSPGDENPHDVYTRFCGEGGMGAFAEYLARPLDVRLDQTVEALHFHGGRWTARTQLGTEYSAPALLLTAPLPQSLDLFDSSRQVLPAALRRQLESVNYEPCFTVLALLRNASKIPPPGALYLDTEPIAWLADNFQKGISSREGAVTIHSTPAFARAYYDEDQTSVGRHLIEAVQEYLDSDVAQFQVRLWRYAKAENTLRVATLHVPEFNLCFAGDGLCAARIEGAFSSGRKAARVLGGLL
jgi:predicted NAD/FAD-dependent oxidoreductase